jgi:hypothetical protein
MKVIVRNIILFLLPIILVAYLLDYMSGQALRKSNYVYFKVWNDVQQGNVNSDIVVYGSSRARKQFNPKVAESIWKYSTYNLGLDGQTIILQKTIHDQLLANNPKPKLIVFIIDQFTVAQDKQLFNADQMLPYFNRKDMVSAAKYYETFSWSDYYLPMVRYAGRRVVIKEIVKSVIGKSQLSDKQYKGFTYNTGQIVVQGSSNVMGNDSIRVDSSLIPMFTSLLDDAKEQKIKMVFVVPPMHHEHTNSYIFHKEFMQFLEAEAKRYNIPILNYHEHPITQIDSLFGDPQHVNLQGAEVFTKIVVNDIQEIYPEF